MTRREFSYPLDEAIRRNVDAALAEDVGAGDLTASLVAPGRWASATVVAREAAILCGTLWFDACFSTIDPSVRVRWQASDGDHIASGSMLCTIDGPAGSLLTGERSALNFLQLLSGVATRTAAYVELVAGTRAEVVDTRKTLPGLRVAQKYAVCCGGGGNHRMGLFDAILIKENHIATAGGVGAALEAAKRVAESAAQRCRFIQIEVENLAQLDEALEHGAKLILLDNFTTADLVTAVRKTGGRAILEASGGVNRESVRRIAETGVDRISIGELTKDVRALDLSMRFIKNSPE